MKHDLINNDKRFRKVIENSYSGVTLLDADFKIVYRSPSAERITGWNMNGQPNVSITDMIHPDDLLFVKPILQTILTSPGLSQTCNFRSKHFKGNYIWVEATYTNMLNEPDVEAIVCNFKDITAQKMIELALAKQTDQINELLETMTDGFITLDEDLCYTYVNSRVAKMLGRPAESLIGQHIWTVFPDAVGSATYLAIEAAFRQKKHVCNEDYYAALGLWQENRAYPSGGGVSIFIRDITKQKKEEHHLKLLESVITNASDAILITEAEPFDEPGPRILYVNEAFTQMTGYTADEVIGKTPRILQGPKSDKQELKRLSESLRKWEPCEISTINYKKNGEEFWLNFSVSPVADEKGWFTHWISIDKDITDRKKEESKKKLLADISLLFSQENTLQKTLEQVLEKLIDFGDFVLAEVWLVATDKRKIKLTAQCCKTVEAVLFFNESADIKSFKYGESMSGAVWESKTIQFWENVDTKTEFVRRKAAKISGLKSAYGIPLFSNGEITGVLCLGLNTNKHSDRIDDAWITDIGLHIGAEIKRKQLEEELSQIFNFAPDVICIAGIDGYFKKVNPALCNILEYTAEELLSKPLIAFIHPDDQEKTTVEFNNLSISRETFNFETRCPSKAGKIKWLKWTSTPASEDGLLFCVARDVTDKKELEGLLNKATQLARIGGWEIDLLKNTLIWSDITKEIHEVAPDFEPDIATAINFYKEGEDRLTVSQNLQDIIENGQPTDMQLQIVTPSGKTKWVRVMGEAVFVDNQCVKVNGSFQDIDALKKAEIAAKEALEEKNIILESIDDAFFAVDKNWVVNYWNTMAEVVLNTPKSEILDHNLWEVFSSSIGSVSYKKYAEAVATNQAVHFEDYHPPLQKWYDISAYPSVNGLSVYFKDVTERKMTDNLLLESEKRYSELFQLSPIPKWVYDQNTLQFLDVNKAAIKHYGYSRNEFLQMTIKDIRPVDEIPKLEKTLAIPNKANQLAEHGVFIHQKKNGDLIRVEVQSNAIDHKGKKAKVVIANDITERLNYIKAIEDQNDRLKEVSWMQSHVIRAPLARMMGLIDLIKNPNERHGEKELMMEYLATSATELDAVIKNITDLSNIDTGN